MPSEAAAFFADRLLAVPAEEVPALVARADQAKAADPELWQLPVIVEALARLDRSQPPQVAAFRALVGRLFAEGLAIAVAYEGPRHDRRGR